MTRESDRDPPPSPRLAAFDLFERPAAAELAAPLFAAHAGRAVRPGESLGPYRIIREVGHGGMAVVYLAQDPRHGRQVALKVVDAAVGAAVGRQRFLQEIQLAARLLYPHILPVFDSGESGGRLWYAMPYVAGETLRQRLSREPQRAQIEASLGRPAAAAALYREFVQRYDLAQGEWAARVQEAMGALQRQSPTPAPPPRPTPCLGPPIDEDPVLLTQTADCSRYFPPISI
jgi:Protein kinase domain